MEQLFLNHAAVFAQVARHRSITKAAANLGMPKSTVSRWLTELEQHLGARLVERSTRTVTLTEAGELYYEHAARIVREAQEAHGIVAEGQSSPQGILRLTAPEDVGECYMTRLIVRFIQRYPDVQVVSRFTNDVVDLIGEGFDVAIRAGSLTDSSLVARRVFDDALKLFASPAYLEERGVPTRIEHLSSHRCVAYGEQAAMTWRLNGPRGDEQVSVAPVFTTNSFTYVRRALLDGAGVGMVPELLVRNDVESARLVQVLPDYGVPSGSVYVVYPSGRHLPAKTRAFVDFAVEQLKCRVAKGERAQMI